MDGRMRIQRICVSHFRCLRQFEFSPGESAAALLLGRNGAGKSSLIDVLEIFQKIGRGENRVENLVGREDFSFGDLTAPVRIELRAEAGGDAYRYALAFDHPAHLDRPRVLQETLECNGESVFRRDREQTDLRGGGAEGGFAIDWNLVALPVFQEHSGGGPVRIMKTLLGRIIVLDPIPSFFKEVAEGEAAFPSRHGENLLEWLSRILGDNPAAYGAVAGFMRGVLPDFIGIRMERVGADSKRAVIQFSPDGGGRPLDLPFGRLSSGEKCFLLMAALLAANLACGPFFCVWDEPDNYLSLSEVGPFVMGLRRAFLDKGQLIVTSHNPEAILKFSGRDTFVLLRDSHAESARVRYLDDLRGAAGLKGDLLGLLTTGDLYDVE